jgi:alkanesulfonate monooxygenase SsuD/methylene tetrahydromethanopterin reductase-like flavin-dependent oxidoreductase (luciferase family)
VEIGTFTFAEVQPDPHTKETISPAQRLRDVVELAVLADQAGLSVFGVGEHHRSDFAAASPAVVLGGIAARTTSIRLTSSVTVLSSADPVSVFEDFTAVDLLSGGRAEIMAGRGAFVESFPLYGYDVDDYDALFAEKIDLLLRLRDNETLTWRGRFRPPLNRQGVYPRPVRERLPVWIGVGGTPTSVLRAARLGVPMAIGIIGGNPAAFAPLADLYREQATVSGFDLATLPLAITSHAFVAPTSQEAADAFFPHYASYLGRLSRGASMPRSTFERARELDGHLLVGSPA